MVPSFLKTSTFIQSQEEEEIESTLRVRDYKPLMEDCDTSNVKQAISSMSEEDSFQRNICDT